MKMCQTSSLEALVRCTKVHIHHEQLILIFILIENKNVQMFSFFQFEILNALNLILIHNFYFNIHKFMLYYPILYFKFLQINSSTK